MSSGINGIAGNGGASRLERRKVEKRLFNSSALHRKLRYFFYLPTHLTDG
jgi:hypothetical protein